MKITLGNTRQKKKYYVVKRGRNPGVYYTWDDCKKEVQGFNGAVYKSFVTKEDAEAWYGKPVKESTENRKTRRHGCFWSTRRRNPRQKEPRDIAEAEKTFPAKAKKLGPALKAGFRVPDTLTIYTDGSCLSNPDGPGGFGAVFLTEEGEAFLHLTGGEPGTTNNRMELPQRLRSPQMDQPGRQEKTNHLLHRQQVPPESHHPEMAEQLEKKRLDHNQRHPRLNQDLWKGIDAFLTSHALSFEWTKGHAGAQYNELCDQLAKAEASRFQ